MRRRKRLVVAVVLVVFVGVLAGVAWLSHGYLWSLREMKYKELLRSLPEPPGRISETDRLDTTAYSPFGFREYEVSGSYTEVIEFLRAEIPRFDLQPLTEEDHGITPSKPEPGGWLRSTSLFFAYKASYCLEIHVLTSIDEQDTQVDNWVKVSITISEEAERTVCGGFRSRSKVKNAE